MFRYIIVFFIKVPTLRPEKRKTTILLPVKEKALIYQTDLKLSYCSYVI